MKQNIFLKSLLILFLLFFALNMSYSQTFLNETFNGNFPPQGWTIDTLAQKWVKSESNFAGGDVPEARFRFINANVTSRLISPPLDLSGYSSVTFSFRHLYEVFMVSPKIGAAYRIGNGNWNILWETQPQTDIGPEYKSFVLTDVGHPDVQFCLYISGETFYVKDWFIDNVKVSVPKELDAALTEINIAPYIALNTAFELKGKIVNEGEQALNSFDISYSVDGGNPVVYSVNGLNIETDQSYYFTHPVPISLASIGAHHIVTSISQVNGGNDVMPDNNTMEKTVHVVPFVPAKKVLVEEATGTWCGWCTRGICLMDLMAEKYPDTWIGVAVHNNDPMMNVTYDNAIPFIIPGFVGYPMLTSDRTSGDSDPLFLEQGYERRINTISVATLDIVNFDWNPASRQLSFDLLSEFVADVADPLRFGVIITEDSLWGTSSQWNQTNAYAGGQFGEMCGFENLPSSVPAAQMHYDHVARTILDTPFGTPESLPQPIAYGSVHSHTYTITIPATWRFEKLNFIGFIVNSATKEIVNANNAISHYVNINEQQAKELNFEMYPNPSKGEVNIVFDAEDNKPVEIQLIDVMGNNIRHEVSKPGISRQSIRMQTGNLSSGTYFVKLRSAEKTIVRKLIVQH